MSTKQSQYNQAIDTLSYLVLHYPKPLQELLEAYKVFFQGKPSKKQLINEVVELLKEDNAEFTKDVAQLIEGFSSQQHDPFWGAVAKGAVGILGGLFGKKKRRRSAATNHNAVAAAQARAAAQAAAAKRDMEMRIQRMRREQERIRREAEQRRREQEAKIREEAQQKAAAAKKKTQMMLMIGGGVVLLGIGAAVVISYSKRTPTPYGQPPLPMPK